MTKKGHQKIWEIDEIFGGNAEIFQETPKKGRSKILPKFGSPRFWSSWSASGYSYIIIACVNVG